MDARGPQEGRLLAVERGCECLDRKLEALRRRTIALSQGVWAAWGDAGAVFDGVPFTPMTPTPTPTATLTNCCTGFDPGTTIPFVDSVFGSGTLTWDPGSSTWIGWLSGVSYAGGGACSRRRSRFSTYSTRPATS